MVSHEIVVDHGHPWDSRPGWDGLYVWADTADELAQFASDAANDHWHPWIMGTDERTGRPAGFLYKPTGATGPWKDDPARNFP